MTVETSADKQGEDWFTKLTEREPDPSSNYQKNVDSRPTLGELDRNSQVAKIADALEREHAFLTLEDTDELLVYDEKEGIYKPNAEALVKHELQMYLKEITGHAVNEVVTKVKQRNYVKREFFDADSSFIHVANGYVNLETLEFKDHDPEIYSLHKVPVDYKIGATCPEIYKFLDSTLDPESIAVILRMIAYCLLPSNKFEKAFMLVGEGANGKSTLISVIKALLGKENCSAVSLQDIASNKFSAAELQGKMVNLHPDLKADKIKDGGYFKALVSGDRIKAERKYGQPFELENKAKLVFSANEIPETDDESYAYFRRWVIVPFNHTFEGENRDTNLLEKLITPEELSGLLYWALICLRLLIREKGFGDTDIDDIRKQYQLGASKIDDFIKERCDLGEDKRVRIAEFNNSLSSYCKEKGSNYLDVREVGRQIAGLNIERKQLRVKGEKAYYYIGIGLKESVSMSLLNDPLPRTTIPKVVQDSVQSIETTKTANEGVAAN